MGDYDFAYHSRRMVTMGPEQSSVYFLRHVVPLMGEVDSVEAQRRKELSDLGFDVAFSNGVSHSDVLALIHSPEVIHALATA